jgi:hypothetical protein
MPADTRAAKSPEADDAHGAALRELRKLREGPGLTNDRLEASGALMSALGTSDPADGRRRMQAVLAELGATDHAVALAVDLGLDLAVHLGREPSTRERTWLGERRAGYGEAIGKDVKTLARWSDKAAAELRTRLFNDTFTGHLWVIGAVRAERIVGISFVMEDLQPSESKNDESDDWKPRLTRRESVDYENPSDGPSLPCLLYGLPRDWRPATLTLVATFVEEPHPSEVWGIHAPTFFEMSYAHRRTLLDLDGDTAMCRFVNPRHDRLYGLWWTRS